MTSSTEIQLNFLKKTKNICEEAELFEQNRHDIKDKLSVLSEPGKDNINFSLNNGKLTSPESDKEYTVRNNVVDFCQNEFETSATEWVKLNKQFFNYHKSLYAYTFINSIPIVNYLSEKTGLGEIKDSVVIDVGAGTGYTCASFFQNPSSIDYYLFDPNLRLFHDQFLRVYPSLLKNKLTHLLCYAKKLHFQSEVADLVMSLSSIDHFNDYNAFFKDSHRVLKGGGRLFIASHLDNAKPIEKENKPFLRKIFSYSFFENLTRKISYKRYKVGTDDHTNHFETIEPVLTGIQESGFKILDQEEYLGNFWVIGQKQH